MSVREAAVAGQFYPASAPALQEMVLQMLGEDAPGLQACPKVLIVPHAGLIYSGAIAASAYRCLMHSEDKPSLVVLLGPAHRVALQGMALPTVEAFDTPLGEVPLAGDVMESLGSLPDIVYSDEAHRLEHSLEVQLPFLRLALPQARLLPVVVGRCPPDSVAGLIDSLWSRPDTLFVISTDLSHFHSYEDARERDLQTCRRILRRDDTLAGDDACGSYCLNGLMRSQEASRLRLELLAQCNSGDRGAGKKSVVGYAAFAMH